MARKGKSTEEKINVSVAEILNGGASGCAKLPPLNTRIRID